MSVLLQSVFPQLWHSDPAVRLEASVQLVGHLEEAQKSAVAHAATDDATTEAEEATISQQVDGLAPDVSYTLKRLIRGLASPRESSRIGFAVALTELLTRIPDILPRQVYPLIKSSSEIASGSKGSEERDLLFARLFAIHAIASSGFLFRSTSSLYDWRVAVEEVLYLGERKAWLRESAGWVIQGATRQLLQRDDVEWKDEALKILIDAAFKRSEAGGSLEWTPERLALAIQLQNAGVQANWENITKSAFAEPQILSSSANLPTVARILRGLSTDETSKKANEQAQSAYLGTTQLHFVWTEIMNVYFGAAGSAIKKDSAKPVPFLDFYKVAVDGNLFTETASIPAKYVGLMAVKACLTTVDSATIPHLLTQNVLRTLMNHLAKGDRTLHGVAVQIARTIPTVAQANQPIAYDILLKLFNPPVGTIRFDALTRTKTVEGLVAALDIEGIKKYTNWPTSLIIAGDLPSVQTGTNDEDDEIAEDEDEEATASKAKDTENRRLWAIDQLGLIVRKHAKQLPLEVDAKTLSTPEYSWTTRILQFFIVHGFTKVLKTTKKSDLDALRQKPEEPFTESLQQAFRSRFFSALSHLVTVNTKCRSEPWAKQCLNTLLALQKDAKHVSPLTPQETVDSIAPAVKLVSKVNSLADKQKAQYLSLFVEILILLSFDPSGDAVDFLEQMIDAVEALINAQKPASTKPKAAQPAGDESDEGEEAEPISVLIDLLVELMQKSSALLRTVSERVFSAASGEVTEQALQLLLDQIVPETFEMEEDEDEDEDEEASDDEDAEEANAEEAGTSSKKRKHKQVDAEESDDSSDDDEDGDDDDDLDLEVDEELRAKILEALKESGVDEDQVDNGESDDEEEEEDELLDDDQMMELDDKLAEIFKARKAASKSAKDAMQATHNAQLKVIDLLEIFAKQQSASPLILQTILPLFNAARRSGKEDVDIAAKAHRVLNGIVSKAKEYPTVNNVEEVLEVLRSVHQGAARSGSEEIESLAIATSLYLCKIALATSSSEAATAVTDIYISSLNTFLIKKSCRLHGRFFESFSNRYRDEAWQLREPLLEGCSEDTKTSDKHRRATCFHLMSALLATHASQKSPQAKQEVIDFAPRYVQVFLNTFEAATAGKGMALQVIRLREILKACSEAVRATKNAIKVAPQTKTWELWRSPELNHIFTEMVQSTKIEKCGSLTSYIRNAMNLINQGSGQANLRNVKNGEPAMLPIGEDGKPITKLAARQRKKQIKLAAQAERQANKEASTKKQKPNKRKAQSLDAEPRESVPAVEENGASTSEDSD